MKQIHWILVTICILCAQLAQAQRKHSEAFEKGIVLIDLQTSLGLYKDRNFVTQRMPVFAGVNFGVDNSFSVGAFAGWNQRTYKDAKYPAYDVNYYYYGGRFTAHLTEFLSQRSILKFNPRTVDIYATLWAGRQNAKQVTFTGPSFLDSGSATIYGFYGGVRIYTMYRVGVLVEFGAGPYGLLNLGICTKI
jgi:hypothetical protein